MAWVTPKTDWKKTDPVMLDPDYARIRGNILHLRDMARQDFRMWSSSPT